MHRAGRLGARLLGMSDPLTEIAALRARLAELEQRAGFPAERSETEMTIGELRRDRQLVQAEQRTEYERAIAKEYEAQEQRRQRRYEKEYGRAERPSEESQP